MVIQGKRKIYVPRNGNPRLFAFASQYSLYLAFFTKLWYTTGIESAFGTEVLSCPLSAGSGAFRKRYSITIRRKGVFYDADSVWFLFAQYALGV